MLDSRLSGGQQPRSFNTEKENQGSASESLYEPGGASATLLKTPLAPARPLFKAKPVVGFLLGEVLWGEGRGPAADGTVTFSRDPLAPRESRKVPDLNSLESFTTPVMELAYDETCPRK